MLVTMNVRHDVGVTGSGKVHMDGWRLIGMLARVADTFRIRNTHVDGRMMFPLTDNF